MAGVAAPFILKNKALFSRTHLQCSAELGVRSWTEVARSRVEAWSALRSELSLASSPTRTKPSAPTEGDVAEPSPVSEAFLRKQRGCLRQGVEGAWLSLPGSFCTSFAPPQPWGPLSSPVAPAAEDSWSKCSRGWRPPCSDTKDHLASMCLCLDTQAHTCTGTRVCTNTNMGMCTCKRTHIKAHTDTHNTHMHGHTCVHTQAWVCACVCT